MLWGVTYLKVLELRELPYVSFSTGAAVLKVSSYGWVDTT